MKRLKGKNPTDINVYLIGSGIASLASAVYLIEDAGVPAANIHILEKSDIAGGALDGAGAPDEGFVVRGGRMHEEHFECYWDLLSRIASLEDPDVSVRDETFEFTTISESKTGFRIRSLPVTSGKFFRRCLRSRNGVPLLR